MTKTPRTFTFLCLLTLALTSAVAAEAQRGSTDVRPDSGCFMECREKVRACLAEARPAAEQCREDCQDLVDRARDICTADRASDECLAARRAALECLRGCQEGVRECLQAGRRCATLCRNPNAECVLDCREDHAECVREARADARACQHEKCSDEYAKAREVCAEDRRSDECREATAALRECLVPCREQFQLDVRICRAEAEECVDDCRTDVPETDQP